MSTPTVVQGQVGIVSFRPAERLWFLTVFLREEDMQYGDRRHQIDDASYFVDGKEVTKSELIQWLAVERNNMPRAVLTGNFGAYPTCDKAEFFSSEVKS